MVGSAARAASAPPNAWTAPLLSRASPECVPENSAASTTVLPAGSAAATLAPLPAIAPAASTAMTVPSLAASSRTGPRPGNCRPAVPALSPAVPSAKAAGTDLDRDLVDARELIVPRPVEVQGACQRRTDAQRRGRRIDVI